MMTVLVFSSCDQSEHQVKAQLDTTQQITNRTIEECDDCPIDYCCCGMELISDNVSAQVLFCGAYFAMTGTPCGPISPGGSCSTISGTSGTLTFPMIGSKHLFCVPSGGSFMIQNVSGFTIRIRFTCQYNETNPDEATITLTNNQIVYYQADGDCFISPCN